MNTEYKFESILDIEAGYLAHIEKTEAIRSGAVRMQYEDHNARAELMRLATNVSHPIYP